MSYGGNAMAEEFEEVTVLDRPMLFLCGRIDRSTVPRGLYVYDVRHDDDQQGLPVEIADHILVNHWGTLLSSRPIRLLGAPGGKPYRLIDPDRDWNYEGVTSTVRQYLERHPPRKENAGLKKGENRLLCPRAGCDILRI